MFAAMKPGAYFVNVARGGLVDQAALLAALECGQVRGAGLDVHAVEPADPDSPRLRHPGVLATPHVGGLSHLMFRKTCAVFAENVLRWAAGGPFSIVRFAEYDLPDVVYLEQLTSSLYLDKHEIVDSYLMVMDQLCVDAVTPTISVKVMRALLKEL